MVSKHFFVPEINNYKEYQAVFKKLLLPSKSYVTDHKSKYFASSTSPLKHDLYQEVP